MVFFFFKESHGSLDLAVHCSLLTSLGKSKGHTSYHGQYLSLRYPFSPWCPLIPHLQWLPPWDGKLGRQRLPSKEHLSHMVNNDLENANQDKKAYDNAKSCREMTMEITEAMASAKKKLIFCIPFSFWQCSGFKLLSNTVCHHYKIIPRSIWGILVSNWCSCAFQVLTTEFCPTSSWAAWLFSLE